MDITVIKGNEKLEQAYDILVEKVNGISEQFQLSYFELYGIIEAVKCDLHQQLTEEED